MVLFDVVFFFVCLFFKNAATPEKFYGLQNLLQLSTKVVSVRVWCTYLFLYGV